MSDLTQSMTQDNMATAAHINALIQAKIDGSSPDVGDKLDLIVDMLDQQSGQIATLGNRSSDAIANSVLRDNSMLNSEIKQSFGMDVHTGKLLSPLDHLYQSIENIIFTPLSSRVMRRTYGSIIFELIDENLTQRTLMWIYAAIADALHKWEPRFLLKNIQLYSTDQQSQVTLQLAGDVRL